MRVPVMSGRIERRVLVNYQVDLEVLQALLPAPFRAKETGGVGIAGICLIRLAQLRPRFLPPVVGLRSENAAHRFAVEWDTDEGPREGVFVPRRDTSSYINTLVGGRLFPGKHHRAHFDVAESEENIRVALRSVDGDTSVEVHGSVASELPATSVFGSVAEASAFFERGSIGYSATEHPGCFDCLELRSMSWHVEPLDVHRVASSYFSDTRHFPRGSTRFDSALLMRDIRHEWHAHDSLTVG